MERRPRCLRTNGAASPLDAAIAAALADANTGSAALLKLIREAESAADAADEAATKEHARALDPACLDSDKAWATLQKIERGLDRLDAAVPRLWERYREAHARERAARWATEYERVAGLRDVLAEELSATYPPIVTKLIDLFARIAKADAEVNRINSTAPEGESRRLRGVELAARSLDCFTTLNPPIARELRLPHPGETSRLAFPPAQVNFGVQLAEQVTSMMASRSAAYGPDWAAAHAAENELRREDAARAQARIEQAAEKEKQDYLAAQRVAEEYRRTGHKP